MFASNVYSEGSHTEVGVYGLIRGCNTLDYGGSSRYFAEAENTVFDAFLNENYDVSYIASPVVYVSEKLRHDNNFHQYYTITYKFLYLWRNRLDYWAQVSLKRELTIHEKECAINLCKDTFNVAYTFWKDASEKKESVGLIKGKIENVDAATIVKTIVDEKKKFEEHPWEYVKVLFADFHNNILVRLTDTDNNDINNNFINYVKDKNKIFLKQMKWRQIAGNVLLDWHTIRDIGYGIKDKLCNNKSDNLKSFVEWVRRLHVFKEFELNFGEREYLPPSIKKQLNFTLEILKKNRLDEKPSFIYLQPEELHYHNNWFSYDIIDKMNVEKEFRELKRVFSGQAGWGKGYLTQSLALNYVDQCLKEFFVELKNSNLLNNTVVLITGDHGSSYGHAPIRNALAFNNFFSENYHIPLFIYNHGKAEKTNRYLMNCDIVPILLETLDIDSTKFNKERSIFIKGREIVHSEYMGPGYQDLLGKKIWFSARNSSYKINYIVGLSGEFSNGKLEAVYNVKKDPKELHNLVKSSYDHKEANKLLNYLEKRYREIQMECGNQAH